MPSSAHFSPADWVCPSCNGKHSASAPRTFLRGTCLHDVCRSCLSQKVASVRQQWAAAAIGHRGAVDGSAVITVSCPLSGCARGQFHLEVVPVEMKAKGMKAEATTPEQAGARKNINAEAVVTPASEPRFAHLKPRFEVGDEVFAAWLHDGDEREGEWFLGKVASYKTVESTGKYGPVCRYEVHFDDGDKDTDLEEQYVMSKEDYELKDRHLVGVKNVTDKDCNDEWARVVGWYVADVGGEEKAFSRLSDAMEAHDDFIVNQKGTAPIAKSELNRPENYPSLWKSTGGTSSVAKLEQDPYEESDGEESRFSDVEIILEPEVSSGRIEFTEQAFMTKPLFHLNSSVDPKRKVNAMFREFVEMGLATPGFSEVPESLVPQIANMTQNELRMAMKEDLWFTSKWGERAPYSARILAMWLKNAVVGSFIIMRHEYPKCQFCPDWLKDEWGAYNGPVYVIGVVTKTIQPVSAREKEIAGQLSDPFSYNFCLVDWKRMGRKDDLQDETKSYIRQICQPTVAMICKNRKKIYDGGATAESIRRDLWESSREISEMVDVPWQTIAAHIEESSNESSGESSGEDVNVTGVDEDEDDDEETASRKRKADALQDEADPLVQFQIASMPSSIREVVRLMDKLEPGREYYLRQEDCRGECSKLRGKLRKLRGDLGVAHWTETGNWKPPNKEALSALMLLIRKTIDDAWP
ncbi:hypothetical protein ACHAXT_007635 [Thalassiosira profunda]